MSMKTLPLLAFVGFLLFSLIPARAQDAPSEPAPPLPDLEVSLEETSATVAGVTPGGRVGLVLTTRRIRGFGPSVSYGTVILGDDDQDGVVRYEMEDGVPTISVWVAVDLSDGDGAGRVAKASPGDFRSRIRELPARALERGSQGRLNRLRTRGRMVYAALLRPGAEDTRGAWQVLLEDGADRDEDGEVDGSMLWAPDRAEAVEDSPPAPDSFESDDVLVLLQPRSLELVVFRVRDTGRPDDPGGGALGADVFPATTEGVSR